MCGAIAVSFFAIIPLAKVNHCFSPRNHYSYVLVAQLCDGGTLTSCGSDTRRTFKRHFGMLSFLLVIADHT